MLRLEDLQKPAFLMQQKGPIQYMSGALERFRSLFDLEALQDKHKQDLVFVTPFCAARDNGMEVKGDEDMLVIRVRESSEVLSSDLHRLTTGADLSFLEEMHPDIDDESFAEEVLRIQKEEIAQGNACQVVHSRKFQGRLENMSPLLPLILFTRLLSCVGVWWWFRTTGSPHGLAGHRTSRRG